MFCSWNLEMWWKKFLEVIYQIRGRPRDECSPESQSCNLTRKYFSLLIKVSCKHEGPVGLGENFSNMFWIPYLKIIKKFITKDRNEFPLTSSDLEMSFSPDTSVLVFNSCEKHLSLRNHGYSFCQLVSKTQSNFKSCQLQWLLQVKKTPFVFPVTTDG